MGAAGMLTYPAEFLHAVRDETAARGILLIADEVFTGFGRTGACFATELAGVEPDLLVVGKAITGGTLTLAAVLATDEVFRAFLGGGTQAAFLHGHSYTANPIACAAALASLDLLDDRVLARARAIGDRLDAGLAPLRGRPGVRDVRGIGSVRAVELVDPDARGYLAGCAPRMTEAARTLGVLLRPLGDVVYTVPPLCVTDDEVDRIARAMVAAVEAGLGG
jgi:adenosylmethionine-8-amino-7-oxononanoate aminotransferase